MINISLGQIIIWLIVGALAGSLTGLIVTGRKRGFGRLINLLIGLIGALLGGVLFDFFNVNLGLGVLTITVEDIVAAFVGSLLLVIILAIIRRN